jgi:hypothetical protein
LLAKEFPMKTFSRHPRAARTPSPQPRLNLESLERRDLLASVSLNAATGVLLIDGDGLNNSASVSVVNGQARVHMTSRPPDSPSGLASTRYFNLAQVKSILFHGRGGDDRLNNLTTIRSFAYGGDGRDDLRGGSGVDILRGGAGNDYSEGGLGQDFLYGDGGNDLMHGNGGDDRMYGGADADVVRGGNGSDILHGGGGNDQVHGDAGNDCLSGDAADDSLFGGAGSDRLCGGDGKDTLVSIGGQQDRLRGNSGLDSHWMDSTDVLEDDALEGLLKRVHRVSQFQGYSFGGPSLTMPVSKELNGQNLADPLPHPPTQAGDLFNNLKKNFKGNPLFASGGPSKNDVFQNGVGDCYFAALMSALAKVEPDYFIKQMVADLGDGTYAVRFYQNGQPRYVRVDADLYTDPYGAARYAKFGADNSLWFAIVEKAWAFFRYQQGSYPSIEGGNAPVDYAALGLGYTWFTTTPLGLAHETTVGSATALANWAKLSLNAGKPVKLSGPSGLDEDTSYAGGRTGAHVYLVDDVFTNAEGTFFKLRNPIGGQYVQIPAGLAFARCIEMIVGTF